MVEWARLGWGLFGLCGAFTVGAGCTRTELLDSFDTARAGTGGGTAGAGAGGGAGLAGSGGFAAGGAGGGLPGSGGASDSGGGSGVGGEGAGGSTGCLGGLAQCGLGCVDLLTDPENCGACAVVCNSGEFCGNGACSCPAGEERCGAECVDVRSRDDHCGACGLACVPGARCVLGACTDAPSDWTTLGHDMQRTSVNPGERGRPPLTLAWSRLIDAAPLNPVVVEQGRLVATTNAQSAPAILHALRAADGAPLWSYYFGEVAGVGQPTLLDGRVYVQHGRDALVSRGRIYSFDVASGSPVWWTDFGTQRSHYWAPAVGPSLVYAACGEYSGLCGFHRDTGLRVFFSEVLEEFDEWAPTLTSSGVLSLTEGNLRRHDPLTGAVLSTIVMPWTFTSSALETTVPVRDGLVYTIAPPTLHVHALDTRELRWQATKDFWSFPAVSDTHVYALDGGTLAAFQLDGTPAWTFAGDGFLAYPPIVAGGHVYVASDAAVFAVDAATGNGVWESEDGGWLSIASGMLFVARADGVLDAYRSSPSSITP